MAGPMVARRRGKGSICSSSSCVRLRPSSPKAASASFAARLRSLSRIAAPLITMARWNRPRAAGIARSVETLPPPPDWPKIVNIAGIAAEPLDIVAHPFERGHHVERAGIAGLGELRPAQLGKMHEAQNIEPVIDAHHHNVVMGGETGPVEPRRIGRAVAERAAVIPHHDRALRPVTKAARPHIE